MRIQHLLAALVLTSLTATPALAQAGQEVTAPVPVPVTGPGQWSVTPFLSFTFGGDSDSTSLGVGGALGYDLTDRLGLEGELFYVFDLAADTDNTDRSLLGASANVLYHVPLSSGLVPYGTFGVGFGRSALTIDEVKESSSEVGFNFGGGLKGPLTERISARGDIRYFKYNDAAPDGWRVYAGLSWKLTL